MPKGDKLTAKQQKFADKYLECSNATESAKYAGYSEKTAYSQGQRLLKNVEIQKILDKKQQKTSKKLEITRESQLIFLESIKTMTLTEERKDYKAAISATQEQNKLLGLHEASKLDVTSGGKVIPTIVQMPGEMLDDNDPSDSGNI